jgi:hypothetical protein
MLRDPTTGTEYVEAQDKALLLKSTFFPTPPEPDLQDIDGAEYQDQVPFPDITEKEVYQTITSTPLMKAAGPDGIINRILHVAATQIAPHLTRIFN